jgi:hypothetical protein
MELAQYRLMTVGRSATTSQCRICASLAVAATGSLTLIDAHICR